jgi:hypothetical protein
MDYDDAAVGWRFTAHEGGKADAPDDASRKLRYDTALPGYGNGGHTFADPLSQSDRAALIEYLKTL